MPKAFMTLNGPVKGTDFERYNPKNKLFTSKPSIFLFQCSYFTSSLSCGTCKQWNISHKKECIWVSSNDMEYSLEGLMLKLKHQYFGHLMRRTNSFDADPDAEKDWRQEKKGTTEDEMVGWHHQLDGPEFERTLGVGVGDGQGGLACCDSWGSRVRHN